MRIYFITSNHSKFLEAKLKLEQVGIELQQKTIVYPEIQSDNLEAIVKFALKWLEGKVKAEAMIEDSGLFIQALNDFPGPYSAWVQRTIGNKGILKLMDKLPSKDRKARFKAVIGYKEKNKVTFFKGECKGLISKEEKGKSGFGYDPIFVPTGERRTFAQMSAKEKNRYSHRGKALDQLVKYLTS
jgi:XTP/dITP diphosphohydrolase